MILLVMNMAHIYPHELIGMQVKIVACSAADKVGDVCEVVDETKSTITLMHDKKTFVVFKNGLELSLANGEKIRGEELARRSHERVKGK